MAVYIWAGNNQRTVQGPYLYEQFYVNGLSPYTSVTKELDAWNIDGQYSRPAGDVLQIARYTYSKSTQYQMSVNFTQQVVYNGATYSYCGTLICEYSSSSTLPQRYEQTATSYTFSPSVQGGTEWCLVPVYIGIPCTLTCDGNGGTPATQSVPFRSGETVAFPNAPSRPGYTFSGWLYNNTLYQAGDTLRMTTDGTCVAQWTESVVVTFDPNGGYLADADKTRYVSVGSALGTLPTPIRSGYTFLGWFTAASGGTQVTDSTVITESTDVTYYAHWSKTNVYAMLDAAGGTCSPAILEVAVGGTYAALPTPTRPNYSFDGWFTAASGGTQVNDATIVTSTVDHTLYAHWTAQSTPVQDGELIYDDTTGRLIYDDKPVTEN